MPPGSRPKESLIFMVEQSIQSRNKPLPYWYTTNIESINVNNNTNILNRY